jgi:bifunctional N-acetylglucosamine-1-phosphate-uridyltransferase/glucosamine-1-phosphate-acetyltransferase GlmU-like protein
MNVQNILKTKCNNIGDTISSLISDLYNENKYKNILFVRTSTTGEWLDNILVDNQNITRILYHTDKVNIPNKSHTLTKKIHSNDLENQLTLLNKTFDLICIDTWHEYDISSRDFRVISSLLNDVGILISHDCYPWNKVVASPSYIPGHWCGETYISFVNFAYNNPNMFYTVLNIDTGIGIISKKQLNGLSNTMDRNKQEKLLSLQNTSNDPYTYFIKNSKDIINAKSP